MTLRNDLTYKIVSPDLALPFLQPRSRWGGGGGGRCGTPRALPPTTFLPLC